MWSAPAIGAVVLVILWIVVHAHAQQDPPRRWFLDPSLYEGTEDEARILQARQRMQTITRPQIDQLVSQLIDGRLRREDYILLEMLEERAIPSLVRGLGDPRVIGFDPAPNTYPQSPIEGLWRLLEPYRPQEAIAPLNLLLGAKSYQTRAEAGFALGVIGSEACVEGLERAVADPETHVMNLAITGIEHTIVRGGIPDAMRAKLFEVIASVIDRGVVGGNNAPEALLGLDRERAIELILSDNRMNVRNPRLTDLLKAVAEAKVQVPQERIVGICDELAKDEQRSVVAYNYALVVLARSGHASARARINAAIESNDKYLREYSNNARLTLEGLENAYQVAFGKWKNAPSLESLPDPVRAYVAVNVLNNEVRNGGFEQYFANSYGEQWKDALWGLEQVKATQTRQIAQEVIGFFGTSGPAPARADRVRRMNAWTPRQVERLDELESKFYDDPDNLPRLLADYVIMHRSHFVLTSSTQPSQ